MFLLSIGCLVRSVGMFRMAMLLPWPMWLEATGRVGCCSGAHMADFLEAKLEAEVLELPGCR